MSLRHDYRSRPPEQVRVVVFGATGYIGRFVVKELVERGYQVVAFARELSGVGGRQSRDEVIADFPGAEVRFVSVPPCWVLVLPGGCWRPSGRNPIVWLLALR